MGCANSSIDPEIKKLAQKINSSIQAKSTLQYQISQLKFLQDAKKSYPDIKEVKEAQIHNLKLSKEIKDIEFLLNSIKSNEMQNEDTKLLEETYAKLQQMLAERDEEIAVLEEDLENESKLLEDYQATIAKLNEDSERLQSELETLMKSDKYQTIKSLEDAIEQLEITLEQKTGDFKQPSTSSEEINSARSSRKSNIPKLHQQLIIELKRKAELEETLKDLKNKTEGFKEAYLAEELKNEIHRLETEEKELNFLIQEAEDKKKQLEKSKIGIETRESPFDKSKEFDLLESKFERSISSLMNGVGDIRNEKEILNEENKKLKKELESKKLVS